MLSDKEKKEMLSDGLSLKRKQGFLMAAKRRPQVRPTLNDYIAFLMDVQKIKPFEHKRATTSANMNIL